MSKLLELMRELGRDAALASAYEANPEAVMQQAGLSDEERRALMVQTFLPRPKRNLQSSQYVLDAKLDMPVGENHYVVVGGQMIDGELDDGVFGMEEGGDGAGSTGGDDPKA